MTKFWARLAALSCLPLAACAQEAGTTEPPYVRTEMVDGGSGSAQRSYTGVVAARIESNLGFRVGGKIVERLVDEGQLVRRGQPLFRLDPGDLGLSASAAAAEVREAEAEAVRAGAEEKRLKGLVAEGATSQSAYDAALAAREAGVAKLAAARAAAGLARRQTGYALLVADADGVVTRISAQPGEVVAAGAPVLTLARGGPREAAIAVPETDLAGLPMLASAQLYGAAETYPARLREKSAAADPATRTFSARYVLDGAAARAPLGATISVTVAQNDVAGILVPLSALHEQGRGAGLWIVGKDSRVFFRRVRILRYADDKVLVEGKRLASQARIVTLGVHLLREGQRVRLRAKGIAAR